AQGSGVVSAKFLKLGANDFLAKPFSTEEFYARVTQNIELMEFIEELRETAIRDPMTKLYNRRYFFEEGPKLLEEADKAGVPVTMAMIDIDRFKDINDRFGHEAGDAVIVRVADFLTQAFGKSHVISRFGGEEFCVLAYGLSSDRSSRFFDDFRRLVEHSEVRCSGDRIRFTVSVGVVTGMHRSLDALIREADRLLYSAKRHGRNRVAAETPGRAETRSQA
ncbi:MAG: diguanylate cyclase, partial [Desulfobacteraceae bacterium]